MNDRIETIKREIKQAESELDDLRIKLKAEEEFVNNRIPNDTRIIIRGRVIGAAFLEYPFFQTVYKVELNDGTTQVFLPENIDVESKP